MKPLIQTSLLFVLFPLLLKGQELSFSKDTINVDTINPNITIKIKINFKNTGEKDLLLYNISGNGHSYSEFSKDPIKPGNGGSIQTALYNVPTGDFIVSVTITGNFVSKYKYLFIKGYTRKTTSNHLGINDWVIQSECDSLIDLLKIQVIPTGKESPPKKINSKVNTSIETSYTSGRENPEEYYKTQTTLYQNKIYFLKPTKMISKKGQFKKDELWNGEMYIYTKNGILGRILIIKDGLWVDEKYVFD